MKFSFIMPVWKGKYLREAIQSILNQTYHDFELVIVDDCSPEPIQSIVESMSTKNIHCRYYRNSENIGGHDLIAQWNHCLEYAQGEYIILATDDDFYEPFFLSTFNQLTYKYPQVNLFRSRLLQVNADNQILNLDSCYKEYLTQEEFTYHMLHDMKGGIPQYIFKRKTLQAHGGFVNFPKAWASDDATAIMMAEHGCVNSQEHLVRFRWSDINISSNTSDLTEKVKARILYHQWLKDNIPPINPKSEWTDFYQKNIRSYLDLYNKITLVSTIKTGSLQQKIKCYHVLYQKGINTYELLSIIYHTLI